MKLTHEDYEELTVFAVRGDLTSDHVDEFRKSARSKIDASTRDFVIDVSDMEYVDSQGLEALLWLQEAAGENLGQVRLAGTQENVEKILEITRLDTRFDRHHDVDAAIRSLRI